MNETKIVTVDGERCNVSAYQIGSSTWKAFGRFRDKDVVATGRTSDAAFASWRYAAEFEAEGDGES
jgi:hypothetical protein